MVRESSSLRGRGEEVGEAGKGCLADFLEEMNLLGLSYSRLQRCKPQVIFISSGTCQLPGVSAQSGMRLRLPEPLVSSVHQWQRLLCTPTQQAQWECFSISAHQSPKGSGLRHPTPGPRSLVPMHLTQLVRGLLGFCGGCFHIRSILFSMCLPLDLLNTSVGFRFDSAVPVLALFLILFIFE